MPLPLIPLIASLAPSLVKLATGSDRAEAITKKVAEVAAEVTGETTIDPGWEAKAQAALEADPELQAQLRIRLQEIEQTELEALLADKQNARARDVRIRELGGENRRADIMVALAFGSITAICALLIIYPVPDAVLGFLTGIGGMFARNIGTAFDFEFGSSRGSKEKDRAAAEALRPLGGNQ